MTILVCLFGAYTHFFGYLPGVELPTSQAMYIQLQ